VGAFDVEFDIEDDVLLNWQHARCVHKLSQQGNRQRKRDSASSQAFQKRLLRSCRREAVAAHSATPSTDTLLQASSCSCAKGPSMLCDC
jgi:hypothetical protein